MKMSISARSKTSFKVPGTPIGDVFYTFEYGEERFFEDIQNKQEYDQNKQVLWDAVNNEVGKQITETLAKYKK